MAEQSIQDVVNQTRSDRDSSPSDVIASQITESKSTGEGEIAQKSDIQLNTGRSVSPLVNGVETGLTGHNDNGATSTVVGNSSTASYNVEGSIEDQNVQVNGDGSLQSGADYVSALTASAEVSGGSDTDTARPDGVDSSGAKNTGEKGHNRSQSVKKPGAFKAVSVTKNFLAKATTGTTPATKVNENKPAPTATGQPTMTTQQIVSRPRLVAKPLNGLRDVTPRSGTGGSAGQRGAGPDPNQVWNKNRPVQPPPPKQFTDEELKQTYGIHLATRLQADEAGKEAKWADIDDDDDDWAPDTIEWNDGTKITLPQHEEQAMMAEQDMPGAVSVEAPSDGASSVPSQSELNVAPADNNTVSKPTVSTGIQPKSGGLVLKGAPEKPTLVAKPQGPPTPIKSPWAPLPHVDKVSPIAVGQQQQLPALDTQGSTRFQKETHGFDVAAGPPQAKEIAADDFNRSWRENQSASSRELYNSHSGRYEPVGEGRRGSARFDQNIRQPSVLQRPAANDQQGPAEPSAAFQTSRAGGHQDSAWGRRRASSNVSGGSGSFARRMSFSKGQDAPNPSIHDPSQVNRRGSNVGVLESPASPRNFSPPRPGHLPRASPAQAHHPQRGYSPIQPSHSQQWQPRASPVMNHVHPTPQLSGSLPQTGNHQQQLQYTGPSRSQEPPTLQTNEIEDPIALQARIMRDARELAKRRKEEQREREEAEKQERIKARMAALGVPEKETKPANEVAPRDNKQSTQAQNAPKPFAPESLDEVRQFGLMKVHPTESTRRPAQVNQVGTSKELGRDSADSQATLSAKGANVDGSANRDIRLENGQLSAQEPALPHIEAASRSPPADRKDQPWKNVPAGTDKYTSWGGAGMTTHSTTGGNLWGPPSNDKALGNGTFDRGFSRYPGRNSSQQQYSQNVPGPIGPPNGSNRAASAETSPPYSAAVASSVREGGRPPLNISPPVNLSVQPVIESLAASDPKQVNAPAPIGRPGPIAPPSGPSGLSRQQRTDAVNAWNNLPAQLVRQDAEAREQRMQDLARHDEDARLGIKREDRPVPQVTYNETWRQISGGPQGVHVGTTVAKIRPESDPASTAATSEAVTNAGHSNASINNRGSRFFPASGDTAFFRAPAHGTDLSSPPSPPPPTAPDHPAYDGDAARPQVTLPPMAEETLKIIVKLPPPSAIAPPSSVGTTPRTEPVRLSPKLADRSRGAAEWQARIKQLVGSKRNDLAISSATKAPLELPLAHTSATVSLPRSEDGDVALDAASLFFEDNGDVTSRATEEALLEEREFGSLPVVRLPARAPMTYGWKPAPPPLAARTRSKFHKHVQVISKESYHFHPKDHHLKQGIYVQVRLPGFSETKPILLPRQEASSQVSSPHPGPRSPSSNNYNKRKPKPTREGPTNYGSGRSGGPGMQPGQQRPGFHSNTTTWGRRVSEAVQ